MCSKATSSTIRDARGITLVELVVVLGVLGIIAAAAAIALRDPLRGYVDSTRRAQLTDIADTALRRVARDIRLALPNSVRVTTVGSTAYVELLLTKTGGRYRAQVTDTGAGDVLDFAAAQPSADNQFDTLGPMSALAGQDIATNDILVVHNLFSAPTVATANAYTYNQAAKSCTSATQTSSTCNTARVTGTGAGALAGETRINFDRRQFPLSSPGNRFHVVSGPVTYVCNTNGGALDANGNGTGTLTRVSGYTINLTQPTGAFPGAPVTSLLAQNVTDCQITYDPLVLTQSLGLVSMRLELTRGNEKVRLYHEIHVSNLP
jgi:MSHA biogenesis protein MshO